MSDIFLPSEFWTSKDTVRYRNIKNKSKAKYTPTQIIWLLQSDTAKAY